MKGVILAGGLGKRLLPITRQTNKHMVPILNKPMIHYPLSTLRGLRMTDIIIISGGEHIGHIAEYFRNGTEYGVRLTYKVQDDAGGIAQALGLAEDFVGNESCLVILGDNVFDNKSFLHLPVDPTPGRAKIFTKSVPDANRFGVYDRATNRIVEKPSMPVSDEVVTGLYVYPKEVFSVIKTLKPSARGELEITDVNNYFLENDICDVAKLEEFWSDAGTPESLYRAIQYVANKEGF